MFGSLGACVNVHSTNGARSLFVCLSGGADRANIKVGFLLAL